jgi:hypothetical protein
VYLNIWLGGANAPVGCPGRYTIGLTDQLEKMDQLEKGEWLCRHIPHRVRAATAFLDMRDSLLNVEALIGRPQEVNAIYWRCAMDSIWEGRLAATRWLIEFIGIKRDENKMPTEHRKRKNSPDVQINEFDGGDFFDKNDSNATKLADMWKGCAQASSHATRKSNHPDINETALRDSLKIVLQHLQDTIYHHAGKRLRDHVLSLEN